MGFSWNLIFRPGIFFFVGSLTDFGSIRSSPSLKSKENPPGGLPENVFFNFPVPLEEFGDIFPLIMTFSISRLSFASWRLLGKTAVYKHLLNKSCNWFSFKKCWTVCVTDWLSLGDRDCHLQNFVNKITVKYMAKKRKLKSGEQVIASHLWIAGRHIACWILPRLPRQRNKNVFNSEWSRVAAMAEWLRRWTRNPMGSSRAGSNPARSDQCSFLSDRKLSFYIIFLIVVINCKKIKQCQSDNHLAK